MFVVEADNSCGTFDLLLSCLLLHAVTAVFHEVYARRGGSLGLRWAEYTGSAAMVFLHTAVTSGTRDIGTLICIIGASVASLTYGYLFEALPRKEAWRPWNLLFYQGPGWVAVGGVLAVIMWGFLLAAAGSVAPIPSAVTWIVSVEMVLLPSFAFVNLLHGASGVSLTTIDVLYAVLSFTSKVVPTSIYVGSIMQ